MSRKVLPEIKKKQGTFRDSRHLPDVAKGIPIQSLPMPPKGLHKNAHETWYIQAGALMEMKILTAGDYVLLEAFCNEKLKYDRAVSAMEDEDMIVDTNSGATQMINLYLKIQDNSLTAMLNISKRFGFDPVSRMDIGVSKSDKNDPLADQLQKKNNIKI